MPRMYRGNCHCGRVTFELDAEIGGAIECNCSICFRRGALWLPVSDPQLRIVGGESELALYQFGTMTAKHYFCRHCGIHPFARPRIAPDRWAVNLRCIDGIDLSRLPIPSFDGAHWEEAAAALLTQRRS
jgi:hypothetical protein